MRLKIIAVLVLTALLVSCSAEIAEPDEPQTTPPLDSGTPPTEGNELDINDNEFPSLEGWTAEPDGVVDEIEPEIIDEPEDTPEPRDEFRMPWNENGLSLIEDEETEITTELKALLNRFVWSLYPQDNEYDAQGKISINGMMMVRLYNHYAETGRIDVPTDDELLEMYGIYRSCHILFIEYLDYIIDDIFSKKANNIVRLYRNFPDENGAIDFGTFGATSGYEYILKEQFISEEIIELYFYYFYFDVFPFYRRGYLWCEEDRKWLNIDDTVVGHWDDDYIFYTDMLDTLGVVKYTFILEDGRYKILSIESVTT
jgi:hypothetical protein